MEFQCFEIQIKTEADSNKCPHDDKPSTGMFAVSDIIRLDALAKALSVIATATWLGGWLAGWVAGCPSHSGIVSKRLNLSENFFDHLKAPSF